MTPAVAALLLSVAAAQVSGDFAGYNETLLARLLAGTFRSDPLSNPDPDYFEVVLSAVPVMKDRDDGPWLYTEHAVPGRLDAPFRQRVYRFVGRAGAVERRSFTLREPGRFAGAAVEPAKLDVLTPADLVESPGCNVAFKALAEGSFSGATEGTACRWDTPDVAYVTTEMTIAKDTLRLLERAYDAGGKQLWGAKQEPYVFRRVVPSSEKR